MEPPKPKERLKYHLVDGTSLLTESNPVFAAFEVGIAKMSPAASMNARMIATALTYLGMGTLYAQGRDASRKLFNVAEHSKERIQLLHDLSYTAAFNSLISPPIYITSQLLAGEPIQLDQIIAGTASAAVFGSINGPAAGYALDVGRDLTGLRELDRPSYPATIKRQPPTIKKALFAGLVAGSIGTMGLIYQAAPNQPANTTIEETQSATQDTLEDLVTFSNTATRLE